MTSLGATRFVATLLLAVTTRVAHAADAPVGEVLVVKDEAEEAAAAQRGARWRAQLSEDRSSSARAGSLRFQADYQLGGLFGSDMRSVHDFGTSGGNDGTGALMSQVAGDLAAHQLLAGAFFALGFGLHEDETFAGVRAGFQPSEMGLKLMFEGGAHAIFAVDRGLFTRSNIPGAVLPFVGARVDWAPAVGRIVSPLVSFCARTDLSERETSGTVTSSRFLETDTVERRAYKLGGFTAAIMAGVSFDFAQLTPEARARRRATRDDASKRGWGR